MSFAGGGSDDHRAADSFKATVTHVASEYKWLKIYVQRDYDSVEQIEDYMQRLEDSLSTKAGFMHQGQIPLATPCFARFSDNKWYRAVCSAWPKNDPTFVEVTFIDYGNPEIVSVSDVRRAEDNIFRTPPLAMECFLDGVDMMLFTPQQAADVVEGAKNKLLYQEVTVRVRRHEQVPGNCIRPFVSIEPAEGGDLASFLDRSGSLASPVPTVTFRYQNLVLGKAYQAYVSHVESMDNVYLHLVERDPSHFLDSIQEVCKSLPKLPASQVQQGTVCLARFSEDGLLYRSLVIACSGTQCEVMFVDYGNHEIKATSELISIPPEFLLEPVFAVRCTAVSTGLDKATFESLTLDTALTCRFLHEHSTGVYAAEFPDLASPPQAAAVSPASHGQIRLQKLGLDPGNEHVMYVSFFESANVMYAQLKEMVEEIEQTSDRLASESPSMPLIAPSDLVPGLGVVCQYEGIWYRAEVLGVNGTKAEVWLADYGDTVLLEIQNLRQMDPKYTLQPAYAVKLSLKGLDPQVSFQVMEQLQNMVLDAESKVQICDVRPDGTHVVNMFVNDPPVSVVGALRTPVTKQPVRVLQPQLHPTERLTVTSVSPPNKFFGQLLRVPEGDLDALQNKLLAFYTPKHPNRTYQPQQGDYVCCRYSEDSLFYRAKVTGGGAGGRCNVFYIDFGNEESVPSEDVFELAPDLAEEQPTFGIMCVLESGTSDALLETEVEVQIRSSRGDEHTVSLTGGAGMPTSFAGHPSEQAATVPASYPTSNMSRVPKPAPPAIAELRLDVGQRASADVVFVASHSEFYCQLSQNEQQLNTLMDAIAKAGVSQPPLGPDSLEVGLPCCALYSADQSWYRGVVKAVAAGGASVFFVDYGNMETVPLGSLRALPPGLLSLPRQAVRCQLRDFHAAVSDELTARLDEMVSVQSVTIEVFSNHSGVHEVSVFLADGSSVADVLKREVQGSSTASVTPSAFEAPALEAPFTGGYQYPVLPEGAAVAAEVSWVLSPGEVYVQLTDSAAKLTALMEEMQAHYGAPGCRTGSSVIRPGQACVSKYSEDGQWYRARVTHAKGGLLGIHYVDYGNCEEVPEHNLRQLLPRFAELPAQAIRCTLQGVDPPGGSGSAWPPAKAGDVLESIFTGPMCCRLVAQNDGVHLVNLERAGSGSETSLVDALVAAGVAKAAYAGAKRSSASDASLGSKLRAVIAPAEVAFQPGQFVDVKVVSVASAEEVWCCIPEGLDVLLESLQKAGESAKKLNNPLPGEAAVARCPFPGIAGDWARALVRSRPSPAKLELFFVDLGLTRILHHGEVKQIPQELTEQPGQAFQCSLDSGSGVNPDLLSSKILGKELVLQVREQVDVARIAGSLFDTSGEEEVNVLSALSPQPSEVTQDAEGGGEAAVASERATELAAAPSKPQESEKAQEVTRTKTAPPQFNRSQSVHVIVPCYPPLNKIAGKMSAYVMHVEDLSCFYVMRKDQEGALEELSARLQEHCATKQDPRVQLVPKLPCVALYPQDNLWYRAKVLNDSRVLFVDYGNADEVEEVRELAPEFLDVPPFCYKCKLDGARDLGADHVAIEAFQEIVLDTELELEVVTWGPEVTVRLSKEGKDVGALVKASLVRAALAADDYLVEDPSSEDVTPGMVTPETPQNVEGYISHIDRLDSFYVIASVQDAALTELSESLQERLGEGTAALLESPTPGMLCGALYAEDGLWYRARIEGVGEDGRVSARFVDYGNAETVDSVVALTDSEAKPEPFCFECRLSGVSALDGALLNKFKEVTTDATLRVDILEAGPPARVRLVDANGTDVTKLLGVKVPEEPAESVETSEEVESVSRANESKKTYSTISVPLNRKLHVKVSHSVGPTDFYVQLEDRSTELDAIVNTLLDVNCDKKDFEISEGAPCVALYEEGVYCRATVLSLNTAEARVFYVDYGNVESVELKEVFLPSDSLFEFPALAIRCTLDVADGDCTAEVTEKFQTVVDDESRQLLAEFLGKRDGRYVVRLLDMGIDILGHRAAGDSTLEVTGEESSAKEEPTENFETSSAKDVALPPNAIEELPSSIEADSKEANILFQPETCENSKEGTLGTCVEAASEQPKLLETDLLQSNEPFAVEAEVDADAKPDTDAATKSVTNTAAEEPVGATAAERSTDIAAEPVGDTATEKSTGTSSSHASTESFTDSALESEDPSMLRVDDEQPESKVPPATVDEAVKDQQPTEAELTGDTQEHVQAPEVEEQAETEELLATLQVEVAAKEAEATVESPTDSADGTEDTGQCESEVTQNNARVPTDSSDGVENTEGKEGVTEPPSMREVVDKVCAAGADTQAAEVGAHGDGPTTNGAVGRLTPSPPLASASARRKGSLDDCIIPGVCTNAELLEAPSASSQ